MKTGSAKTGDFSQGSIPRVITSMALPLMAAGMVNLLYNIVDRIYIGNIPGIGSIALAGLGIASPVINIISAFAGLFGIGGVPLFSIARGRGECEEADRILSTAFSLLLIASAVLVTAAWSFLTPILRIFAATDELMPYAKPYLAIYVAGTPFVMISLGLNGYINAQGYPKRGMLTVILGAALNIALDPLFIFGFHMGVAGAAWATVLSQMVSAVWCLTFLLRGPGEHHIRFSGMRPTAKLTGRIMSLGVVNFIMQLTNALIHIVANRELARYGGEMHLGAFVIINSLRNLFLEAITSFANGMQPVLGYNYGARLHDRVLRCIRFTTLVSGTISVILWAFLTFLPEPAVRIFTQDAALIAVAKPAVRIYFCGYLFMSLQSIAQNTFSGLGKARQAIFFSLLRKVVIVTPLVILLPRIGLGVDGVYWSEPISDLLGGSAAFVTMLITVYFPTKRRLEKEKQA